MFMSAKPKIDRFLLWIDAVGGYWVCAGDEVLIGQPVRYAEVDVPILGDLAGRHARADSRPTAGVERNAGDDVARGHPGPRGGARDGAGGAVSARTLHASAQVTPAPANTATNGSTGFRYRDAGTVVAMNTRNAAGNDSRSSVRRADVRAPRSSDHSRNRIHHAVSFLHGAAGESIQGTGRERYFNPASRF